MDAGVLAADDNMSLCVSCPFTQLAKLRQARSAATSSATRTISRRLGHRTLFDAAPRTLLREGEAFAFLALCEALNAEEDGMRLLAPAVYEE